MFKKLSKINLLLVIYFIVFSFIAIAYSYLNESLQLNSTVGFSSVASYNYTYSYILQDHWNDNEYYYYYFVPTITYNGNDNINSWQTYIYIPDDTEIIGCYESSECIITNNVLRVTNATWNGNLIPNSSFSFGFQIKTRTSNYDLIINNVNFYKENIVINNPSADKVNGFNVELQLQNSWGQSSSYNLQITNNSNLKLKNWKIEIGVNDNTEIQSIWGADYILKNNVIVLTGLEWNSVIDINSTISNIGLQLTNASNIYLKSFSGIDSNDNSVEINV